MDKKFEIRTGRDGLNYLFEHPTLNARQTRWMEFLCEYDFDIKHIKGKENKVVDALSRKICVMHVVAISTYTLDFKDKIIESNVTDDHYHWVRDGLQ